MLSFIESVVWHLLRACARYYIYRSHWVFANLNERSSGIIEYFVTWLRLPFNSLWLF